MASEACRCPPSKSEGAGNAGCTLHPRSRVHDVVRCAHEHTGTVGTRRHSLRNGLTAYAVLSLETNSSCLHRCRIDGFANPVGLAKTSASLTPATGARTTRFCRTQQRRSSCADQSLTVLSTKPETALQCLARASALASTATGTPRIVTTRTPLFDEAG